jgi:hypothetical protein
MATGREEKLNLLLFDKTFRDEVKNAGLIIGVDEQTQNTFIVFGAATLSRIMKRDQAEFTEILKVSILEESAELEALIAVVNRIKGYNDYEAPQTKTIDVNKACVKRDKVDSSSRKKDA